MEKIATALEVIETAPELLHRVCGFWGLESLNPKTQTLSPKP